MSLTIRSIKPIATRIRTEQRPREINVLTAEALELIDGQFIRIAQELNADVQQAGTIDDLEAGIAYPDRS